MSNVNYHAMYNISYDYSKRHYIATYKVGCFPYKYTFNEKYGHFYHDFYYDVAVSFDDDSEIGVSEQINDKYEISEYWNNVRYWTINVQKPGPFKKIYIRNLHPEQRSMGSNELKYSISYSHKAPFEIDFKSIGFASNRKASFSCATIQQNTIAQYEWTAATVYYKKTSESEYKSVAATVSGSWSDVTVSTDIGLEDGYTYDIYIKATADDGTTAETPVGKFQTVDAQAVATCISPVGAFTKGDVKFSWSHSTDYGTPQNAYDLRYSLNNGGSWITLVSHEITESTSYNTKIDVAGSIVWQVRTYNTNDVPGEWAQATFVNNVPALAPRNVSANTKGRPLVSWTAQSQLAYQVQVLLGDTVEYDSGAVYSSQQSHLVNQYLQDTKAYTIRVRIYDALGNISEWTETGYQQPTVEDMEVTIKQEEEGGVSISITGNTIFEKYYILRNGILIGKTTDNSYFDRFVTGNANYLVVGVTPTGQSDIQSIGLKTKYPRATIVTLSGEVFAINRRLNATYQIQSASAIKHNKVQFIGDKSPSHYPDVMVEKSFNVTCFDENGRLEALLGQVVFYADNFGNGGYCFVTNYSKKDDYLQLPSGAYANEASLTLEVTNYDDSIQYDL